MRKIDLQQVMQEASLDAESLPPVHLWNPEVTGDIDIRIDRNGNWYHEGSEIRRQELAKLFSSILVYENGDYFLVTPVEKYRIVVEDKPFVIVAFIFENQGATNQSVLAVDNFGTSYALDADHPLWLEHSETGEPRPYMRLRGNLDALVSRNAFYDLVNNCAEENQRQGANVELVVRSNGEQFSLGNISS